MRTKPTKIPIVLSVIALAMSLTFVAGAAGPVQWTVASGGNGHYYQAIPAPSGITWQAASNAAASLGGYLATPTNAAENDIVYSLVSGNDSFWVLDGGNNGVGPWLGGFLDASEGPNGVWQWVTGEAFSYVPWAPGEPNNYLAEDRIHFLGQGTLKNKTWNDYADDPNLTGRPRPLGYMVEWTALPAGPPLPLSIQCSEVGICWASVTNATYRVEYRSDLTTNTWAALRECVPGSGTQTCIYDKILPGYPTRFYRVVTTNCVPGP
jgi:hypothetical protein